MTRSHKANDRDHKGIAEGTAVASVSIPRFFGKHGYAGVEPKKMKKNGGGKANWGGIGDEIAYQQGFSFNKSRRRSNSSSVSHHTEDFKTKFEVNEPEPVFEESIHGAEAEDDHDHDDTLSKTDSSESGHSAV